MISAGPNDLPRGAMKKPNTKQQVKDAVHAAIEKKAEDIAVLQMDRHSSAFTDYFVVCTGSNPRQIQAISDEVEQRLSREGLRPTHVEGYNQAEWVLLDYVDFVVHVFTEGARKFYDLERLWKSAKRLNPADLKPLEAAAPARKTATRTATATVTRASSRSSGRSSRSRTERSRSSSRKSRGKR